ncbi:hypothetical protein [Rhodoplanes roseus]|nr:hypothetical protein [Rhodoplanes roseus]
MSVSAVSAPSYARSSPPAGATVDSAAGDPADSFATALAANDDTAGVTTPSSTATRSATDSPTVVMSRRDGTVAYAIDPSRVRRLAPPTREGVATLTTDLATELDAAFAKAGLATDPPVTFTVDDTGVHAEGDRDDLAEIDALLAGDVDLRRSIRMADAIAAQAYALETTPPEDSYRGASDPQVAVDRFIRMMESQKATTTMAFVYRGGSVAVTANGAAWPSAEAQESRS